MTEIITKSVQVEITGRSAVVEVASVPTAVVTVTPTGIPGPKGEPGVDGGKIKVPFSWGDASPKRVYQVKLGDTVFRASLVIQVPFNGDGTMLELGDQEESDRLIRADQNNPYEAAEYSVSPGFTYQSSAFLLLSILAGVGVSQGSGFILLEI